MDKKKKMTFRQKVRLAIQLGFTALSNGYAQGFLKGEIYSGPLKQACVPGLNCYSCPGALGACPIGALQATLGSRSYQMAFYVLGFLVLTGTLLGRAVCGFLCPIGLVQDLLYKIPLSKRWKKRGKIPGDRVLKYAKYLMLVILCILLPMFVVDFVGQGSPWFCTYVCPSGTLLGSVPLLSVQPLLRSAAGALWVWKMILLIALLFLAVVVYRPFCRYLCPLGAIYGLFHPVSLYRFSVKESACTSCKACVKACPFEINVFKQPNSTECVRCGRCLDACPHDALTTSFAQLRAALPKKTSETKEV